jgi:hypothetical protein
LKGLLLAGILAVTHPFLPVSASPFDGNAHSSILPQQAGGLNEMEQKILDDLASLENLFQNPMIQDSDWQDRMNRLLRDMDQFNQAIFDQTAFHHLKIRRLPRVNPGHAHVTVAGIEITAGDTGVPASTVQMAANMIQNLSLPVLQDSLNSTPAKNTHIVLFSSSRSYANSLLKSGISSDEIQNIVTETGGLTIGSDIWIPLYNLQDTSDLANVLTHELTHAVLNQKGIGDQIPTWVNEGIAWHNGLTAQNQVNPDRVQREREVFTQQVEQAAASGQLLPLSASEDDILQANYNVEWEDALAVESLLQQYGPETFKSFINGIAEKGVDQSFQANFHMSRAAFEQSFIQTLNQQ